MEVRTDDLESLAREIHDETRIGSPVDAFELAHLCNLELRGWSRSYGQVDMVGRIVWYPAESSGVRTVRQHFRIAHETAHYLLRWADDGYDDEHEPSADFLAGAMMMPSDPFLADLDRTSWDLHAMLAIHTNVSAQACAIRMCQLSPASASVWDQGALTGHYGPGDPAADLELADLARAKRRSIRGEADAWTLIDGDYERVVVVRRVA